MKKILLTFILGLVAMVNANAQVAIETSKLTDNIYVGIGGGVATPLDFNSTFPLNTGVKAVIGKNITPVLGVEIEGLAFLNDNHFADGKTIIKASNIGINGTINILNMLFGYQGKPRTFEVGANAGIGWLHNYGGEQGICKNFLTAKTAIDLTLFIGKPRAIALTVSPGVYWNLNGMDGAIRNIKFNKHSAQLAVMATLTWHFKNSNGTRYFKSYDVGAMIDEISRLNDELAKKPKEVIVEKTVVVDGPATIVKAAENPVVVFFAKGSDTLSAEAEATLNAVDANFTYDILGYASPEGSESFNKSLSQRRAEAVANFLAKRNVKTNIVEGKGVAFGESTNRVAIVTVVK